MSLFLTVSDSQEPIWNNSWITLRKDSETFRYFLCFPITVLRIELWKTNITKGIMQEIRYNDYFKGKILDF